ncbi:MAG: hypothetical protein IPF53_19335 [Blastocatellia bacterium]|nr:hypothetical protein [Blastocatellia bacterium]
MNRIAVCILSVAVAASGLCRPVLAQESVVLDEGRIVTLYVLDAMTSHLSFNDGKPGAIVQGHLTYNRDSQLSFGTYAEDSFTVGIQGGEDGAIVDIGDDAALKARYGYSETVGNVQGFASIHLESGQAVIVKNYQTKQFQPLKEFSELARERPDRNKAQVGIGHMYLIHIWNRRASSYYVKLKVLAYVPGQYVTIRWSRL